MKVEGFGGVENVHFTSFCATIEFNMVEPSRKLSSEEVNALIGRT